MRHVSAQFVFIIHLKKYEAARLATFGTWRMLTLGSEFSSWARTPESPDKRQRRRAAVTELSSKDSVYGESQASRDEQNPTENSKYDTVIELERPSDLRDADIISAHERYQENITSREDR